MPTSTKDYRRKLVKLLGLDTNQINVNAFEEFSEDGYVSILNKPYFSYKGRDKSIEDIEFISFPIGTYSNDEGNETALLYKHPEKFNQKRENTKAVLGEMSYSALGQKGFFKFRKAVDDLIKQKVWQTKTKDETYTTLIDGLLLDKKLDPILNAEVKAQLRGFFTMEYQNTSSCEDIEVLHEANTIVRELNKKLHLDAIIYPAPYDIYTIKGVFGFTDEPTSQDEYNQIKKEYDVAFKKYLDEEAPLLDAKSDREKKIISIASKVVSDDNFRYETTKIGAKKKFKQNIEAIRLIKQKEPNTFTPEDKKVLSQYTGFGGIPQAFYKADKSVSKGWEKEAKELQTLLTTQEYSDARRSTLSAFYTPSAVVDEIYSQLKPLMASRENIKILEPSVGTGIFIQNMPLEIKSKASIDAIELDSTTYKIFDGVHHGDKKVESYHMSYLDFQADEKSYDLIVGNPPFSNTLIEHNGESLYLHEHFIKKSLLLLKDDGVMACVVSNALLDAKSDFKEELSKRTGASLIGAARLPHSAFSEEAHTEVVTDIVYFSKDPKYKNDEWLNQGSVNGVDINAYYEKNQQHLLGEWGLTGTMYQGERPNLKNDNFRWDGAFNQIDSFFREEKKKKVTQKKSELFEFNKESIPKEQKSLEEVGQFKKIGSLFIYEDTIYKKLPAINTKFGYEPLHIPISSKDNSVSETKLKKLKPFVEMKETLLQLSAAQLDPYSTQDKIQSLRTLLNEQYDVQAKKKNFINKRAIKSLIKHDAQYTLLLALEKKYIKGVSETESNRTGKPITQEHAEKADIFFKRTQYPEVSITHTDTPEDALSVSMGEKGEVNIPYMTSLLDGYTEETLAAYLEEKGAIYKHNNKYVTKSEFLSGDVKTKFEEETNERYKRDLHEVIPKDINAYDIEVEFGASWIDSKYMVDFVNHLNGRRGANAYFTKHNVQWTIGVDTSYNASNKYATGRYNFQKVLNSAANNTKVAIYDTVDDERVFNAQETFLANQKLKIIKKEFGDWIFDNKERREDLAKTYNKIFNRRAQRVYDGSILPFKNQVSDDIVKLRPHQKNAAFRMAMHGKVLLDHTVGTGKTFTLIAGLSELKRMGKITKPMVVVPNHKVTDWANDWITLYPNASILSPEKEDFKKENREALFARIMTTDYDAVIIGHSQLILLENDPHFEADIIRREIDAIQESIELMRAEEGKDTRSVKNAEKKMEKLEAKFESLASNKSSVLNFGELGIDYLAVDESHEFKNLPYNTSLQGIGGMGTPAGSKKALDLYMKVRYIEEVVGKPNIAFLTGTPISNTVAELYLLEKYLNEDGLKEQGLYSFDTWVKQYAKVETTWQTTPTGRYKAKDVLSTFQNLPELMQSYRSYADVITNEQIQEILKMQGEELPLPKMIGGKPQNIVIEKSSAQEEFIGIEDPVTHKYPEGSLIYRSENLPKKPTKGADNMLVIIGDAKKCALDMRILDPHYDDSEDETKTKKMIEEAMKQYHKYALLHGTQLIFSDLSVPKKESAVIDKEIQIVENKILNTKSKSAIEDLEDDLELLKSEKQEAFINSFSVYDDIKEKLIKQGVPQEEIAFIHSYDTDEKKDKLYQDVNSGKVRFLLGSTQKMGAGTNVQERLVGLHNLDAPWKPSDLEQREGRIIRQGNLIYDLYKAKEVGDDEKFKEVSKNLGVGINEASQFVEENESFLVMVNRYATKGTLDSRMWEILEQKSKFIEKLKQPTNSTERKMKDDDLESMSSGEMKALASDNPLILINLQIERKLNDLQELKKAHHKSLVDIEYTVNRYESILEKEDDYKRTLSTDINLAKILKAQSVEFKINNFNHDRDYKSFELGDFVKQEAKRFLAQDIKEKSLGKFGEFDIQLSKDTEYGFKYWCAIEMIGEFEQPYTFTFSVLEQSSQGLVTKISNMLDLPEKMEKKISDEIQEAYFNLGSAKEALKPFAEEAELIKLENDLDLVIKELAKPKHFQNHEILEIKNSNNISSSSLYQTLLEDIEKHTKEENSTRFTPTEENFTALNKSLSEVPELKEILNDDMSVAEYSLFLEDVMKYCKYQLDDSVEQKETSFNEFVHTMDSMQEEEIEKAKEIAPYLSEYIDNNPHINKRR